MKKFGTVALAALLTGSMVGGYTAHAQEEQPQVISAKEEDTTNYVNFTGIIKEIEKGDKEILVTLENKDEMIMILRITDESLLFNSGTTKSIGKTDLKKGAVVEAYYDKNKPMILIYPAQVTPEIVVMKNDDVFGEVKIAKFDKDYLSLDGKLKLNLSEETVLLNQQGKVIKEKGLEGKELAVFYDATTRSLPPQTSPSKVIALDYVTEELPETETPSEPEKPDTSKMDEIIKNDHYMKNGVKMIPLRKVAEQLGYHVLSQPKVNGALVTLENSSFTITRGDKKYGYNKSIQSFEVAPELKGMKTYVSEDFLELLIKN
ncbi:stalk domain-containing protein [Sporosarcina sp. FSL K6-1508]|uniref:stalk domain-containing protein n=1 Tax=Sporosarcina sp. FSL K6-1508 TaxID=2921553 RepID=UPI0030F69B4A